jgi:hypothetical protein
MKRYIDYEDSSIPWTKFKIIVPTMEDKAELIEAFREIHYADIDTDYIAVNQIAHLYLESPTIVVDEELYKELIDKDL